MAGNLFALLYAHNAYLFTERNVVMVALITRLTDALQVLNWRKTNREGPVVWPAREILLFRSTVCRFHVARVIALIFISKNNRSNQFLLLLTNWTRRKTYRNVSFLPFVRATADVTGLTGFAQLRSSGFQLHRCQCQAISGNLLRDNICCCCC